MRDFRLACMQTWKDSLFEQLFTFLTNLLTLLTLSDLYLLVVKLIAWIVANITDIIVLISLLECLTFFSHCDQVNQQCEKILIKTLSFPLLSVVNEQPWGDIWLCVNVHLQLSYAQFFSRSRSLPFQNHDIILTMSRYFTNNQLQKEE